MAKKKTTKKASKKKSARKGPAASGGAPTKKAPAKKKAASKKAVSKKAPAKKKAAATKAPAKKKAATKKASTKKAPSKKATSKKAPAKKAASKKAASKKAAPSKKTTKKAAATNAEAPAKVEDAKAAGDSKKKPVRKGITIVSQKPMKKTAKKAALLKMPELGGGILGPGAKRRKPLIPSGDGVASQDISKADGKGKKRKSPFNKRQLDKFRTTLLAKRAELIGDVSNLEDEALNSAGGGASQLPQHIAEQGSDVADQSLNLDLAAADRRLIKEIDDALVRIAENTFGLCEISGEPIGAERLEELPWARYSIETARAMERRGVS